MTSAASILADPFYPLLKQAVLDHTGLGYYSSKDDDLSARLARRMIARRAPGCGTYLRMMEDAAEMNLLVAELTIGETYFFRHAEQFEALREAVIPELLERNRGLRRLRIWSAGCANGAEPYSLALLLWEHFGAALAGWDVRIVGTDINETSLCRARAARFNQWAFREAPAGFAERYFERVGKDWVLRREFTPWVSFCRQNLAKDPPPFGENCEPADLILCRNVMIYFSQQILVQTTARLWNALAPGGWLMVGHSEPNQEIFKAFRTVLIEGQTAYQKPGSAVGGRAPAKRCALPAQPFETAAAAGAAHVAVAAAAASASGAAKEVQAATAARRLPFRARPPAPSPSGVPAAFAGWASETAASVASRTSPGSDLADVRRLADSGKWQEAAQRCSALLASCTLDAAAYFTYALILEYSGRAADVQAALEHAIYLDRGFALAHYHLGLCLYRSRSFRRARRYFQNVIDLLRGRGAAEPVAHGDGITAAELAELARLHLALVEHA